MHAYTSIIKNRTEQNDMMILKFVKVPVINVQLIFIHIYFSMSFQMMSPCMQRMSIQLGHSACHMIFLPLLLQTVATLVNDPPPKDVTTEKQWFGPQLRADNAISGSRKNVPNGTNKNGCCFHETNLGSIGGCGQRLVTDSMG